MSCCKKDNAIYSNKNYNWTIIQEETVPYSLKHNTSNPVPFWGKILGIISLGVLVGVMVYSLCFS